MLLTACHNILLVAYNHYVTDMILLDDSAYGAYSELCYIQYMLLGCL